MSQQDKLTIVMQASKKTNNTTHLRVNKMQLQDFATLALAQAHEQITYRKIGANEARQFFSIMGARDSIESNLTNTAVVQVVPNVNTTVGALCRSVLDTLSGGNFATDPSIQDGQLNRVASAILVTAGALTQAQVDGFFALGETSTKPFAGATEHAFQLAKGTIPTVQLNQTANGDYAIITVSALCENHAPRVTTANGTRITSFYNVSQIGLYAAEIPNEYRGQVLSVDNAYGVVG